MIPEDQMKKMRKMKRLTLSKFDASGNTFLVFRAVDKSTPESKKKRYGDLALKLCSRDVGFCADGVVVISDTAGADFHMDIFNADGSWAERSGNGMRSAVSFVSVGSRKKKWLVECFDETVSAEIIVSSESRKKIMASVGIPQIAEHGGNSADGLRYQLKVGMRSISYSPVSVGNPHAVVQVRNFPADWQAQASGLGASGGFPEGVNVEFAKIVNRRNVEVLVYERGVGPTASSGTGAAACMVALKRLDLVDGNLKVKFPKHALNVKWSGEEEPVFVTGNVSEVFRGEAVL